MAAPLTRRSFLVGGASAVALAACSSSSKGSSPTTSSSASSGGSTTSASRPAWNLIGFYASDALAAGVTARLPLGIADVDGALPTTPPVDSIQVTVSDASGRPLAIPATVAAHAQGLPRAYFPVEFTPPKAGIYVVSSTVLGTPVQNTVQIGDGGTTPHIGQPMIPFDTPTAADPKGVQLLCTHDPVCPLHDVTLTQALGEHKPLAFLIGTPKYCQVGICGPVLDVLLKVRSDFPQVRFLHSEVYPSDAAAQPSVQDVVPVVSTYGLSFEPVLFLAKPDGTVLERLDAIFDEAELRSGLQALVA